MDGFLQGVGARLQLGGTNLDLDEAVRLALRWTIEESAA